MSKVLLVTPKWFNSYPEQPPLGLLYLAGYIREAGHKVWICDDPVGEFIKSRF